MLSFPTVVNQTIPLKFHTLQLGVSCYAPAPQQLNEWITSSGFASCTETLGSESSDDRSTSSSDEISSFNTSSDEENEIHFPDHMVSSSQQIDDNNNNNNVTGERFPPPLPSLNRLDQTSFILRHVRKDGRLELTEIKGNRPEILCATRHNGRLTIRVVKDLGKHDDNNDDYDQEVGEKNKEVKVLDHIHDNDEKGVEWSTTTSLVSQGERVKRRCYEYQVINITTGVAHHHHRHRHCVTTG